MFSNKKLFSWALESSRGLQILLVFMIFCTIFFRVFPLEMQKRIINQAIAFSQLEKLFLYCGFYIAAVMLAGVLKYFINILQAYIGQKILLRMRAQMYEHILSLPLSFFRKTPPGMVIATLTSELSAIGDFLGGAIATPLINVLTLATFAAYLAYLNPLLAAVSFVIYPIEILIIPRLQQRFNRLNQQRIDVTRSMSNVIGEAISGIHEIHGNASYSMKAGKMHKDAESLFRIRHRMNIYKFLIKFVNNFFQSLGPFFLFLLGGYLTIQGRFDLGALVAFLSAYEKLYDPWKEMMDYYQDYQDSRVRYQQILDYFDQQPEFQLCPPEKREALHLAGQVQLEDLSFIVDGHIRILDQVSLKLEPGQQLAVVGLSGSGKSTLAMVIGQLYRYTQGHVKLDGRELKDLSKWDVSHNIGYVAQHPFIFNGTIYENLIYSYQSIHPAKAAEAEPRPSPEEILLAVQRVGLSDDLLRIGLNTVLTRDRHEFIAEKIIEARRAFFQRWGAELGSSVDFFNMDRYQYHTTLAENITFGAPNQEEYSLHALHQNRLFREFLEETELIEPLVQLGAEIARETVLLLRDLSEDPFFFEMSPIRQDEFDAYAALVERMGKTETHLLDYGDRTALLRLALRFIPARHKMVSLSSYLEMEILVARQRFMETVGEQAPESFTFYRPSEYLYNRSILDNILFGELKQENPQAMALVQQRVAELLHDEQLADEIIRVGMEFNVGSKGDRLSGGQKQKIAIARTLLKGPSILILDEATASLDNTSQGRIQHLLNEELKGRCTLISVVHRLEMVRNFDLIAVMKAGKIIELGTYDELIQKKGLFYDLAHGAR